MLPEKTNRPLIYDSFNIMMVADPKQLSYLEKPKGRYGNIPVRVHSKIKGGNSDAGIKYPLIPLKSFLYIF